MSDPITAPEKNWQRYVPLAISLSIVVVFLFAYDLFKPLREIEVFFYLLAITSPLWILLSVFLNKYFSTLIPGNRFRLPLYAALAILLVQSAVIWINARFDTSAEQKCERVVTRKYVEQSRHLDHHIAEFPSCIAAYFSFFPINTIERLDVHENVFDAITPNNTGLVLSYKAGLLKLPWLVDYALENSPAPETSANQNSSDSEPYLQSFKKELSDSEYNQGLDSLSPTQGDPDYTKAFLHYKIAADAGNAAAQHDLAFLYFNGFGVKKNIAKAIELVKLSAQQGYPLSLDDLGVMYRDGSNGLPQDWLKAYLLIRPAADTGFPLAKDDLILVREHLTPEQIAVADHLIDTAGALAAFK